MLHLDAGDDRPDGSFVDLGGNSLSYVAMSVRLERALGHLPTDWQRLPLRELQSTIGHRRRWWGATLETSVALRAVAIVLVVGSHAELCTLWGGAHVLLGIAGYNFGRFCLTPLPRVERVRHLRNTIAWIAVPSVLWVAFALVVTDDYTASNLLLANKFLGPSDSMTAGRLWFVEVVVWILVGAGPGVLDCRSATASNDAGRSGSPWPSWRSDWRCATTSSAWARARRLVHRARRSGSSPIGWAAAKASTRVAARSPSRSSWRSASSATSATPIGSCWCSPAWRC